LYFRTPSFCWATFGQEWCEEVDRNAKKRRVLCLLEISRMVSIVTRVRSRQKGTKAANAIRSRNFKFVLVIGDTVCSLWSVVNRSVM
jgi:hypothetical protein